jgi:hypothetical protein
VGKLKYWKNTAPVPRSPQIFCGFSKASTRPLAGDSRELQYILDARKKQANCGEINEDGNNGMLPAREMGKRTHFNCKTAKET